MRSLRRSVDRLLALEAEAGDPKRWEVTQTTVELARLKDKQT